MGYTTEFSGQFEFNKEVSKEMRDYINAFARTRHMKRDVNLLKKNNPNWQNKCFKGDLGVQGEYFVTGDYEMCFGDDSVLNYNFPPDNQPGLWCDWEITEDCKYLEWNGNEKFYEYEQWLVYLISNFFEPEGYILNGKLMYQGEDIEDYGILEVRDNKVYLFCKE